jgi:ABC-type Fe3+-siderophore transport system permease subunit
MAFAGRGVATLAVYQMAKSRAGMNVERLVLSGVIVTTFLSSILVLLTSFARRDEAQKFYVLAFGRFVAGDEKRILFDARGCPSGTIV